MNNPRTNLVTDMGKKWEVRDCPVFRSVAYGNGIYVGFDASSSIIRVSVDAVAWEEIEFFEDVGGQVIQFVNNLFVITRFDGTKGRILVSSDGRDWTICKTPLYDFRGVVYGNGIYLAVQNSASGTNMTSVDGYVWKPTVNDMEFDCVEFFNGLFIGINDDDNSIYTTPDGETWTKRWEPVGTEQYMRLAVGSGSIVACGYSSGNYSIIRSSDGLSWETIQIPHIDYTWEICYGDGVYLIVGGYGPLLISYDEGLTWGISEPGVPLSSYLFGKLYANGQFLTFDYGGQVFTSGKRITTTPPQPVQFTDSESSQLIEGLSAQRQELTIVVDGTSVYLDIIQKDATENGNDISYFIGGKWVILDCSTGTGVDGKARIELIQGTAISPQKQFIYVTEDEGFAKLSTSTIAPSGEFAYVAISAIQDYATVSSESTKVLQRTSECLGFDGRGLLSRLNEKLRMGVGARHLSGLDATLSITTNVGAEDDVDVEVSSGEVFQLNRQVFGSQKVSTNGAYVCGASGDGTLTNMQKITNINEIHEISDGTALIDGDYVVLTVCGTINYSASDCALFISLPDKVYRTADNATYDVYKSASSRIPDTFSTVGFFICKLVLKYTTADSGTWENVLAASSGSWTSTPASWSTPNYPSNYGNNEDTTPVTITQSGATKMRLVMESNTESGYDFVELRDAVTAFPTSIAERNADPNCYSGNLRTFTTNEIAGDTIRIKFTSDGSITRSGATVVALEYFTPSATLGAVQDLRGAYPGWNF